VVGSPESRESLSAALCVLSRGEAGVPVVKNKKYRFFKKKKKRQQNFFCKKLTT
jgi:hypothetical protein